jgi:hypothetical protein
MGKKCLIKAEFVLQAVFSHLAIGEIHIEKNKISNRLF